jgi:ATP-dependent RNA helicase RhlE
LLSIVERCSALAPAAHLKAQSPLTHFNDLGLAEPLLRALDGEGYVTPTPIQTQAIPHVIAGRDLLGIAQTGTGKTAAFALPILHRLATNKRKPQPRTTRALVLSPTRELASQIAESFRTYGRHMNISVAVVFGGVKHGPQSRALHAGLDVLVATPGRLLDHMEQRSIDLGSTEVFVLDEADQMFDLGFIKPVRRIASTLPARRQNLFFSATMPPEIAKLAGELLKDPLQVSVTPTATTVERIRQQILFVEQARKRALLAELFSDPAWTRTLVFTKTKHGADKVTRFLEQGGVEAEAIHGNKSQGQRERALAAFKAGKVRALVATDIAARGIDVDSVTHVVNFDLPNVPESYVHRIGRTARAGASGSAVSFCSNEERGLLKDIERVTRQQIPSEDRRRDDGLAALGAAIDAAEPKSREPEPQQRRGDQRGRPQGAQRKPGGGQGQRQGFGGDRGRSAGDRPTGDRPTGDRPTGERQHRNDRPAERSGERSGERSASRQPARSGDRPFGDRNPSDRGGSARASGGGEHAPPRRSERQGREVWSNTDVWSNETPDAAPEAPKRRRKPPARSA